MREDEERFVECDTHGRSDAAFVCQHLIAAAPEAVLGFHQTYYDPDNREWGDLGGWCDRCDVVWAREGEWTDAMGKFAGLRLVCASCFSEIKDHHQQQDQLS